MSLKNVHLLPVYHIVNAWEFRIAIFFAIWCWWQSPGGSTLQYDPDEDVCFSEERVQLYNWI